MELGSNEAIKEAILQGLGVAVLSRHAVEKEVKAKQLCSLHLSGVKLKRDLFLVQPIRRALPLAARVFCDLVDRRTKATRTT